MACPQRSGSGVSSGGSCHAVPGRSSVAHSSAIAGLGSGSEVGADLVGADAADCPVDGAGVLLAGGGLVVVGGGVEGLLVAAGADRVGDVFGGDRKSVVEGKCVSVSVGLGSCRFTKIIQEKDT